MKRFPHGMILIEKINAIRVKYKILKAKHDERGRCMWAVIEATSLGYGGVAAVAKATGLSESTMRIEGGKLEKKHIPWGVELYNSLKDKPMSYFQILSRYGHPLTMRMMS